jgi:hypothetical protein
MKAATPQRSGLKIRQVLILVSSVRRLSRFTRGWIVLHRTISAVDRPGQSGVNPWGCRIQSTTTHLHPPEPFGSTGWRPDNSRFNLTGEATVKVEVEQTLNAGVLDGLIDTKINDNNVRQQNMILGIAD